MDESCAAVTNRWKCIYFYVYYMIFLPIKIGLKAIIIVEKNKRIHGLGEFDNITPFFISLYNNSNFQFVASIESYHSH